MDNKTKILLTFTGFYDPYALSLIGGKEVPGPILYLLSVWTERRRSPGEPARTPGLLLPGGLSPPEQAGAAAPALEASHGYQTASVRFLGISPQAVHKFLQGEKDECNPS